MAYSYISPTCIDMTVVNCLFKHLSSFIITIALLFHQIFAGRFIQRRQDNHNWVPVRLKCGNTRLVFKSL